MAQTDDWLKRKAREIKQGEYKLTQTIGMVGLSEQDQPEVVGLRKLPDGPTFLFPAIRSRAPRERLITLGARKECDIRVQDDSTVSGFHCLIIRRHSVYVNDCESLNGTYVDGFRFTHTRLRPGQILRLGRTKLLALGERVPSHEIQASTLGQFLRKALRAHGNPRRAAEAIQMPYTTLLGWIKDGRFAMDDSSSFPHKAKGRKGK